MKILLLTAGAGGMYCGQCLHGNTLAVALCRAGADALLVPAYTPLRTDEDNVSLDRVVFGGINVYLQEKSALFRHTPWLLDRLLDRPSLLRWLGKRSSSTRPEGLGPLLVSMLQGEEGRQRKELKKLLRWLADEIQPDVVHLSTVLLAGMAREITRHLGVPVVATLAGEDLFLEKLPEPHYSRARAALRQRCRDLAAVVALNRYSAGFMAEYLAMPAERIHVIPPGLNLEGHKARSSPGSAAAPSSRRTAFTIGFLARICPEKGLLELLQALEILVRDEHLPRIEVAAAGYLGESDRPYLAQIGTWLAERGLADRFRYLGPVERAEKIAFLQSLDVMSLPTVHPESKGFPVLEAWANGIPVVLPAHGAFPELIADTGGGLLCDPGDAHSLAAALRRFIEDPGLAAACGERGRQSVCDRYHAERMARQTIALYEELTGSQRMGATHR
ncbi:MAG: glycosyltransferase family 4 protein [Thermoguttaceae bacterium]